MSIQDLSCDCEKYHPSSTDSVPDGATHVHISLYDGRPQCYYQLGNTGYKQMWLGGKSWSSELPYPVMYGPIFKICERKKMSIERPEYRFELPQERAKEIVYFVKNGAINEGWIIGHMEIADVVVHPYEKKNYTKGHVAKHIIFGDRGLDKFASDSNIPDLLSRPGKWYYLSGDMVIHEDFISNTPEGAADKYRDFLLSGEK